MLSFFIPNIFIENPPSSCFTEDFKQDPQLGKVPMKFFLTLFILPSIFTLLLYGETEIRIKGMESRISKIERAHKKPLNQITPCAGPRVKGGKDLALFVDFIYWKTRLDTLGYAKTGLGDLSTHSNPLQGKVESVDWRWDPGLKAGMGWGFGHGCWDMLLQYTWLYTNIGGSQTSDTLQPGFDIFPPALQVTSFSPFKRAHAHFNLHYQVGDLEFGRNYYVSSTLKLRPFVGVKGTWQKQDYNVFYKNITVETSSSQTFDFHSRFDHSLWGIGMRGGIKTSWQFSRAFSLYGNIALSGIWLHYKIDRRDTFQPLDDNQQPTGTIATPVNIHSAPKLIKPALECAIGLRAESYFGCGRYHILLQAGWESQIWLNQTLYIALNRGYDRFDLTLHGLTAKLRFDF